MKKLILLLTLLTMLLSISGVGALALETNADERFETPEYYGRAALAALPNADALLYAYDSITAGVEARETSISVWDGEHPITQNEVRTAYDAYRRDRTDHFWLGNGLGMTVSQNSTTLISPSYLFTEDELPYKRASFDAAVNDIIDSIPNGLSELERELYLHDMLANRVIYVEDAPNAHNAYGAIFDGKAVCEGYAEALQVLLMRAGIQSFIVIGDSTIADPSENTAHAWNYVRIGGNYYHVDLTWNDSDSLTYHAYFNISDARIKQDHSISETEYALPVCASERDNYFAVYGGVTSSYTASTVAERIKGTGKMRASFLLPSRSEAQSFKNWVMDNMSSVTLRMGLFKSYSYTVYTLGCEVHVLLEGVCSHQSAVYVNSVPQGCTTSGNKGYYLCKSCNRKYLDSKMEDPVPDGAFYLPPLDHSFESACDAMCDRCPHERTAPHTMTEITGGKKRHTLSCICGENTSTELHVDRKVDGLCDICENPIPVKESDETPSEQPDGASFKTVLIIILSVTVGSALIVAVFYKLFKRR